MRMSVTMEKRIESHIYELGMLALSLFAIGVLAVRATMALDPDAAQVLEYADYAICIAFLGDFLWSLWHTQNRLRYMLTWGWLDLLSSIPTFEALRWGRLGRVLRVIRIVRGLKASRLLAMMILRRRAESVILAAGLAACMLVVFCSVAILTFETASSSNIRTAEDSLWWAFATITTVGYGDYYPVTSEGRLIASILMFAGVGLVGTFSAFLASWFLSAEEEEPVDRFEAVVTELSKLRSEVATLSQIVSGRALSPSPQIREPFPPETVPPAEQAIVPS